MKTKASEHGVAIPEAVKKYGCIDIAICNGMSVQFELSNGKVITYELLRVTRKNAAGVPEWTVDLSIPGGDPVVVQTHLNLRNAVLSTVIKLHGIWRKLSMQSIANKIKADDRGDIPVEEIMDPEAFEGDMDTFSSSISRMQARSEKYGSDPIVR